MKNPTVSGSAAVGSWRIANAMAALLALTCSIPAAAEDTLCADGSAVMTAVPLAMPLPALADVSAGCATFETPTAKLLVGQDGLTYYIGFEHSTGCAVGDAELRRWLECWTYQPASCGADPVTEVIEAELALPASSEWGVEPPCERETEVDPDP